MGIAYNAAGYTVQVSQQQICSFASDSGQAQQLFHRTGYFAIIIGKQHLAGQDNIPCLVLVESAGVYVVLNVRNICSCHGLQCGVSCKKRWGYQIYTCVRTLGRQSYGDHQFVVLAVVECAGRVGVTIFQNIYNGIDFFFHFIPSFAGFLQFYHIAAKMERGFLSQPVRRANRMKGAIGGISMILPLDQVCTGVWACVIRIDTSVQLRQRLKDFGLVPGTRVRCKYTSPCGDLVAIELRGSVLALRKRDLHHIRVYVL